MSNSKKSVTTKAAPKGAATSLLVRLNNAKRVEDFLSIRAEIETAPRQQQAKLMRKWRERVFTVYPAFRHLAEGDAS